jgi:hypothetical protein
MKSIPTFVVAVASVALAGTALAQTVPSSGVSVRENPGVLGRSYTDLHFGYENYNHSGGDAYNAGISGNAPVTKNLDVGLGYDYYWENNNPGPIAGTSYDAHYHQLATNANYYIPMNGVKPFIGAAIGYQWARADFSSPFSSSRPVRFSEDEWVWAGTAGVEIPMGTWAITPRISYSDTMSSNSYGAWHYGAEAHHWFTEKVGGYLDATFHDPRHGAGPESWTYTAGMRLRF